VNRAQVRADRAPPGTRAAGAGAKRAGRTASSPARVKPPRASSSLCVVGVGASAGGLEAFTQLLSGLPPDPGAALVLVQHLDPKHESILAPLLSRATSMPVHETRDGMRLDADHVYVIPPTVDIALEDGHIRHVPRGPRLTPHLPIDLFLRTLADVKGHQAIAVILSGTGADGTLGCQAVRAQGGIAFAQEPGSARFDGMPHSAIAAGCVDSVLPPDEIGREIVRLARGEYVREPRPAAKPPPPGDEGSDEARIFALLKKATGADFNSYRRTTVRRRIRRRMAVHRIEALADYVGLLESRPAELQELHQDLLINVTSFFRDPETFRKLDTVVFPRIVRARTADSPVRVWVPGCATGEEAYSIAISLLESQDGSGSHLPIQVFASDLSEAAIEKARAGVYPENIALDVSRERLLRFFVKGEGHYQVRKAVRDLLVFARHDLTRDPPFSRMDLVSCRNVLIYLEPPLQKRVMATFHYALQPTGLLLLGRSETVGASSEFFTVVDREHKVYSRRAHANAPRLALPAGSRVRASPPRLTPAAAESRSDVDREAQRLLLNRYAPPSLLVDAQETVFHFRGETGAYLDHAQGAASFELGRIVRKELLPHLRRLLQAARTRNVPQRSEPLSFSHQGRTRRVALEVLPLQGPASGERCFLVLFDAGPRRRPIAAAPLPRGASAQQRHIAQLQQELQGLRHYQQVMQEEHEGANEELQAANEEVVSSNEELQSINEELETAKEELQSNNEELMTLNEELQSRNVELQHLHDELDAVVEALKRHQHAVEEARDLAEGIVDTARTPMLILDTQLRVRRANASFCDSFGLSRTEAEGALLYELAQGEWDTPGLRRLLDQVLSRDETLDDYELELSVANRTRVLVLNARKLRREASKEELVLLAMEDRTEARHVDAERAELLSRAEAAARVAEAANRLKDEFVATASHELRGPLSAMVTWTHLLATGDLDAATMARGVAAIERSAHHQTRLIEDLLDVSRITLGKLRLDTRLVDVRTVVEAALESARPAAQAKEIQVRVTALVAPEVVLGDAGRLQQVVWNLLSNAVKFTPRGGAVEVWWGRVGTCIEIRVADDGQGMTPAFLPHVFERFRQADGSPSRVQPGLGLGLSIVRQLVELHGGTVTAASPGEGRGSTFVVSLPVPALRDPPHPGAPQRSRAEPVSTKEAARPPSLQGLRLLVVDDDADGRDAVTTVLEQGGAQVTAVSSVVDALAFLDVEAPPDVLVSDIGMPIRDGYDLIREVRKRPAEKGGSVPALALTAYAAAEDREKTAAAGFQSYLAKPAAPAELVTRVGALAGR
jgi:two-component system CheB/CheR fusion protein